MQHNRFGRKLGRTTAHRLSLFRNQLASLLAGERIVTTLHKAKELRPLAERMVTHGKRGTVHSRRLVGRWVQSRDLIKKLFDEIAPRFSARNGGYLRIVKLGPRIGDGAEMAVLEFVDFQLKKKAAPPPPSEEKGKAKGKGKEAEPESAAEDKPKKKAAEHMETPVEKKSRKAEAKVEKAEPKSKIHKGKSPAATRKSSGPRKAGGA
jgi:large subunit ribosomal protein L17